MLTFFKTMPSFHLKRGFLGINSIHGRPSNGFHMYCHQIRIGDLFVLNTYKAKLCIKMIQFDTIATSNFYSKFKENNENDIAAHAFWAVFCSSQRPSEIIPITENDAAAIPPAIFVLGQTTAKSFNQTRSYPFDTHVYFAVA